MSEAAAELASITGLEEEQATLLLEAAGGDLATAVQLHFDNEDAANGPGSSAADEAAARAAQMEEDARYGAASDDDGDSDGFPEPVADGEGPQGGRRAHSPGLGAGPRRAPRPPTRWARLYGTLSQVPGFSFIYALLLGGGRFIYSTGLIQLVASILWAPLTMLGLVGPAEPPPPPAAAAQRFETWFEENHGRSHPPFFHGSCQSALGRSRSEAKFVLVYLHDSGAAESAQFCDRVMSSARFSAFAAEHFVLWVGDLATSEGRNVRRALRINGLPALVVLAHGEMAAAIGGGMGGGMVGGLRDGPAPVQALGSVVGARALDEDTLIDALRAVLDSFEPLLVAARAEQHERLMDRMMREQQEEEYARALAEDQAREAMEAEAAEAERAAEAAAAAETERAAAAAAEAEAAAAEAEAVLEAKRATRLAKAATLPAEPPADVEATRLVIKLADGRRLDRRFEKSCLLQAAIAFVESEDPDLYDGADFELVSNYPRKVFTSAMFGQTLEELGLHPAATLFTKETDDD